MYNDHIPPVMIPNPITKKAICDSTRFSGTVEGLWFSIAFWLIMLFPCCIQLFYGRAVLNLQLEDTKNQ